MSAPLKIECELLKRRRSWKTQLSFVLFFAVLVILKTAGHDETYYHGRLVVSEGWLSYFHLEDYDYIFWGLIMILLISVRFILTFIFSQVLRIVGTIVITEDHIDVVYFRGLHYKFPVTEIRDLAIVLNHFKINDQEPRDIVKGNNNVISFNRFKHHFRFEFLLQTREEEETYREIMERWETKNISFKYSTTLAEY